MENKELMPQNNKRQQVRIFIELLRSSLFQKEVSISETVDGEFLLALAKRHCLTAAIADEISKYDISDECKDKFEKCKNRVFNRQALFDIEKEKIFSKLDSENILYVPLKGDLFSSLYPRYGMREFSDCDILARRKDFKRIKKIFIAEGYQRKAEGDVHTVFQKKPIFDFELHEKLFQDEYKFHSHFSNILDRVHPVEEGKSLNKMSAEDEYIYVLGHIQKHSKGGLGFRSYVDFALLRRAYMGTNYDRAYVEKVLDKVGLADFEREICDLVDNLFLNDVMSVDDDIILDIASFATYGIREKAIVHSMKNEGKSYLIKRIIQPYSQMKGSHPILKKVPVLYPVFVVVRLSKWLFSSKVRKDAKSELRVYKQNKDLIK